MKVLENYEELSFQINAPTVRQVASIPQPAAPITPAPTGTVPVTDGGTPAAPGSEGAPATQTPATEEQASSGENSITNVEDLFR